LQGSLVAVRFLFLLFPQLLAAADGRMLSRPAWKLMSAAFGRNYLYMPHKNRKTMGPRSGIQTKKYMYV